MLYNLEVERINVGDFFVWRTGEGFIYLTELVLDVINYPADGVVSVRVLQTRVGGIGGTTHLLQQVVTSARYGVPGLVKFKATTSIG